MRIAVFGSTGKTGQEVVKQALERGYEVIAYARNPDKMGKHHPKLTISKGELNDMEAISQAISGTNAVISLLGPGGNLKDNSLSEGVKNIILIMEKHGISRLIQIATPSSSDPHDKRDYLFGFLVGLVKRTMPNVYAEIGRIGDAVRNSKLNWTLIRVPFLNEKPLTKKLRIGYMGENKVKLPLSRADLAWFMLEQLQNNEYVKKAPFISN
jgi:putative NADH-flavin reductase